MRQHILFLSTLNFTTNPRLYKEVLLALRERYEVTVILFQLGNWSDTLDQEKLSLLKGARIYYISATRRPFWPWLKSTVLEKSLSFFPVLANAKIAALAHNKRTALLISTLTEIELNSVDFIVAHNLGALYPANLISHRIKAPFGFDVEDYHPGELVKSKNSSLEEQRRIFLMQELLKNAGYITYASDLIRKTTDALLKVPLLSSIRVTILNSFPSGEFQEPAEEITGPLRMVWFSQNITHGRGLELLLPALEKLDKALEVTLIGNMSESFIPFLSKYPFIKVEKAMPQPVLHQQLQQYDVGLALEVSDVDTNKMLALSNKILAYKQAGLFILATDTPAQLEFLKTYPDECLITVQKVENISMVIEKLITDKEKIRANRHKRYLSGRGISWEKESEKLLHCWSKLLNV